MWGGIGLLLSAFAFLFLRAPRSLIVTAIWAISLPVVMDEAIVLSNFSHDPIKQKREPSSNGKRVIRVATVNCAGFAYGDPAEDLKKWDPDIVLLQHVFPNRVKQMAQNLYGSGGEFRANMTNGIITRFEIRRGTIRPRVPHQQATLRLPNGKDIEVVNVALTTAATDMRLWSEKSRSVHRSNRAIRSTELSAVLRTLKLTSSFPNSPTILGGDFNAGATDIVHRQLVGDFDDTFSEVGRGWGNTFHRRFPVLRIDHVYATRQFRPLSSGVIVSKGTDHRIVISDIVIHD